MNNIDPTTHENIPFLFIKKSGQESKQKYAAILLLYTLKDSVVNFKFEPADGNHNQYADHLTAVVQPSENDTYEWQTFKQQISNEERSSLYLQLKVEFPHGTNPEKDKTTVHYDDPDEYVTQST